MGHWLDSLISIIFNQKPISVQELLQDIFCLIRSGQFDIAFSLVFPFLLTIFCLKKYQEISSDFLDGNSLIASWNIFRRCYSLRLYWTEEACVKKYPRRFLIFSYIFWVLSFDFVLHAMWVFLLINIFSYSWFNPCPFLSLLSSGEFRDIIVWRIESRKLKRGWLIKDQCYYLRWLDTKGRHWIQRRDLEKWFLSQFWRTEYSVLSVLQITEMLHHQAFLLKSRKLEIHLLWMSIKFQPIFPHLNVHWDNK